MFSGKVSFLQFANRKHLIGILLNTITTAVTKKFRYFLCKLCVYTISSSELQLPQSIARNGTPLAHSAVEMGFFDIFIVYLAFGAPFAVFDYLQRNNLLRAFGVFLFWPPTAFRLLSRRFRSGSAHTDVDPELDARAKKVFAKLQKEMGGEIGAIEFRDTFDRYVGLSLEICRDEHPFETKSSELLRVSGRENSPAASASLNRRNAVRLARHHTDARERFLELIERSQEFNALVLALELTTLVGDADAQEYLNRSIGHDRTEGEVWDTQEQQTSKERIAA